jgi:hypothetical protein
MHGQMRLCGAQVRAGGEAVEIVDAGEVFAVEPDVRQPQQQLCDLPRRSKTLPSISFQ